MANKKDIRNNYDKARQIVEVKISFIIHLTVYLIVNILLIIINLNTKPEVLWFKFPMMGWGVGLLIHGIVAFLAPALSGLKERMIEKELKKQKQDGK
jgi:hypothetical protein